ncbi:MAG: chromate transporter [Alphaproteobacteria bacterium]|nr:chromate transporter [Alphaproteobacteria bacterium]
MIYLTLLYEFFKIGLFAVGGGLATIPFLFDLTNKFDWFTKEELVSMIALSESTPGPLGINMATFAGFQSGGILGGITATIGLVIPAFFVIILISKFFDRFKDSFFVQSAFYGLRPAVSVMISVFVIKVCRIIIELTPDTRRLVISLALFVCYIFLILRYKLHPIFFIVLGAVMGILLDL